MSPVQGILHTYLTKPTKLPLFESADTTSSSCLVFLPGLFDGFVTVPYVEPLEKALKKVGWSLAQPQLSCSLKGWGRSSLEQDADEIEHAVQYLYSIGKKTVVLMGHSTGCQEIIHYLIQPGRKRISGAIIQAPASDREAHHADPSFNPLLPSLIQALYDNTPPSMRRSTLAPEEIRAFFGVDITVYRAWSMLCPGGDDDFFSTDLPSVGSGEGGGTPHRALEDTFGLLPEDVEVLVVFSTEDEYTPNAKETQPVLLRRWKDAAFGKREGSLEGIFVNGASHNVKQVDQAEWMVERIVEFLMK